MGINRGKQFEDLLRDQFVKAGGIFVLRLYDVTMGYKEINNPCDLIVYKDGNVNLFECKAIHGNTLNFKSHIKKNQWDDLLEYSTVNGLNAGIIVWFIDYDKTLFIDIQDLDLLYSLGNKSFNIKKDINKIPTIEIEGTKKRVFFEYNLKKFLEDLK